jgi:Signal transduction histidine kinase
VLAVVALVAVLGVIIGLVSVVFLQSYLMGRLDLQLGGAADRGQGHVAEGYAQLGTFPQITDVVTGPGQSPGTFAAYIEDGRVALPAGFLRQSGSTQTPIPSGEWQQHLIDLPVGGAPATVDLGGTLGDYRLVARPLPNHSELVVGLPTAEVTATTTQLGLIIALVTFGALALAAGTGLLIVRLALRPLDRVAATAGAVSELPLDHGEVALAVRVPDEDTDPGTEVGRVGASINRMLGHVASALTARQASENKVRQFVADASHELRTPLASIRGYAELTRRFGAELPQDVVRSIGRIESEATRMTGLVEDLLLLARLDEGRALEREPVDLSRLVIDSVSDAHAAGRDHRWSIDLPGEPVMVTGDEPRLHQVIVNLLANARVHTPDGTTVTVSLTTDGAGRSDAGGARERAGGVGGSDAGGGDDARMAVLSVADDGPGIPPELRPTLFERFARGDSSRSRETGSTGLGLAIVHAVVAAHGGSVSVWSEPGNTVFRVALPL